MASSQEQESQFDESLCDIADTYRKLPTSHSPSPVDYRYSDHMLELESNDEHKNEPPGANHDSLKSMVQDTQYIGLELDTQAHSSMSRRQPTPDSPETNQDSLRSVVADTQFVNMELDTQAVNDSLDKSFGNNISVGVTETGPCPKSITQTTNGLFSRSDIPLSDDVGFRFGRVNLRQPQVARPVFKANFITPENTTDATALVATTSSVSTNFASEFAGGKDNRPIQSRSISILPIASASNTEQVSAISPHEVTGGKTIPSVPTQSILKVGAPAIALTTVTTQIPSTPPPCELPESYEDLPGDARSTPPFGLAGRTAADSKVPLHSQCAKTMESAGWAKQRQNSAQSAQAQETDSLSYAGSESVVLRHEPLSVTEVPSNRQTNKHSAPAIETKLQGYAGLGLAKEPYRQAFSRASVVEDDRLIAFKTPMASPFPHRSAKSRHKIKQPFPEESPRRLRQQYEANSYRAPPEFLDAQIPDTRPPLHEMASNIGRTRTPITDTEVVENPNSCDGRQVQNASISIKGSGSAASEQQYHPHNDLRHQPFSTHIHHQAINSLYVDDTLLPDTQRVGFPDDDQGNSPASAAVIVLGAENQQQSSHVAETSDDCSNAPLKEHQEAAIETGHEYARTSGSAVRHAAPKQGLNSNATIQGVQNTFLQAPEVDIDRKEPHHSRQTSPNTEEVQARPPSPQRNHRHFMARRISAAGQVFRRADESTTLSPKNSNKIRKSNHGQPTQKRSGLQHMQETLLGFEAQYNALLEEVQTQREMISSLEVVNHNKDKEIKKLEVAEAEAVEALGKLKAMQSRYEKHMNEVITSHRFLKTQAKKIEENTAAAKEAEKNSEEMVEKARKAIADVKSIETKAQSMLKNALEKINGLAEENKALAAALAAQNAAEKSKSELRDALVNNYELEKQALVAEEAIKQKELTTRYVEEKQELATQLADANRENHFHKQLIEERVNELGRERATSEQLRKALNEQSTLYHALDNVLKKLPFEIKEKLTTEDGKITKLLSAINVTKAKIDENTSLISSIKNTELDSLAPFAKLTEDMFSKLENAAKAAVDNDHTVRESHAQLLEDLKQDISQLRLGKEKEISLTVRITELIQMNKALTAENNTRERDIQSMTKKLGEVGHNLTTCQAQLSSKNEELLAALAVPKVDPKLQAKIQELDGIIGVLNGKHECSKLEISTLNEQLSSLRETLDRKEQEIKGSEQELNTAHARIHSFAEEKNSYMASKDLENKQTCQDLTRKAESSKATMKLKLESEVRNLEQKIKDKDSELNLANEKFRSLQSERETTASNMAKIQAEVNAYKEQLIQQAVHFQRLQSADQQVFETNKQDLQTIQIEVAELRNLLQSSLDEIASKADKMAEANSLVEASAQQATQSQKTKEHAEEKCSTLQNELSRKEEQCASLKRELEATSAVVRNMASGLSRARVGEHMVASSMTVSTTSRIVSQKGEVPRSYVNFHQPSETEKGDFETPEDHLRQAIKNMGSNRKNNQDQAAIVGSTSTAHHPGWNGHSLELQPDTSSRRPLRAAVRNSSKSGMQKIVETENGIAKTPQKVELPSTKNKGRLAKRAHFTPETSSYITPFSAMSPSTHHSSDLTDIDQIIDGLDDVINNEQLQDAYGKARNGKTNGRKVSDHYVSAAQYTQAARKRNELSASLISSNEVEEPPTKRIRTRAITKSSTAEESRRRRDSKPGKSALKKSTEAKPQEYEESERDLNYTFGSQPIGSAQTSNRQTHEARPRVQDLEPRSIRGVVSGKGGRSSGAMAENRESAETRVSIALNKPFGTAKSPIMPEPRRNQRKLSSSSSSSNLNAASWKVPTGRVTSNYSPRAEVPETEGMY